MKFSRLEEMNDPVTEFMKVAILVSSLSNLFEYAAIIPYNNATNGNKGT